ncbi:MAG: DedA family protein [Actinobacteria bacterium]|nr:DedA family protein [Actinomycetota bacterium]
MDFSISGLAKFGLAGIFLGMCLESMGVPGAGAALDLLAGPLFHEGKASFVEIVLIANIGLTTGSILSYFIGRFFSDRLAKYIERKGKQESFNKAKQFAEKRGKIAILAAQLYGTTRTFISYPAGMLKMDFKNFVIGTFIGGLIYCTGISILSIFLYGQLKAFYEKYANFVSWQVLFGAVIFLVLVSILFNRSLKGIKNQARGRYL